MRAWKWFMVQKSGDDIFREGHEGGGGGEVKNIMAVLLDTPPCPSPYLALHTQLHSVHFDITYVKMSWKMRKRNERNCLVFRNGGRSRCRLQSRGNGVMESQKAPIVLFSKIYQKLHLNCVFLRLWRPLL